jgi:hypothetical protein
VTERFHIHFEPLPGGGQLVTVPEIDARIEIEGSRFEDAQDAGLRAITAYKEEQQRTKRPRRNATRAARASA